MSIEKKVEEARAEARNVQDETENVFLSSINTEFRLIRNYCRLAEHEDGQERAHHMEMAQNALKAILKMAERVELNQQQRNEIEEAKRESRWAAMA